MPTLHLIRHARAESRSEWSGVDPLRPLTDEGRRQAQALVRLFEGEPLDAVLSSPFLRCRQTVEPLASRRAIPIELDAQLAESAHPDAVLERLRRTEGSVAVCCHGELIPEILQRLRDEGVRLKQPIRCEKGALWSLEHEAGRFQRARYRMARDEVAPPPRRAPEAPAESAPEASAERLGVLDLGSTSFHLVVVESTKRGGFERVLRERVMLRLGALINEEGRIPEKVCRRAVETARELAALAEAAGASRILPLATSALRDATNGRELALRLGQALGEPVRILSGAEEARLTFLGIGGSVALGPGETLGLDLGGGSLELVVGDPARVRWETTLELGVARLFVKHVRSDPPSEDALAAVRERVDALLGPVEDTLRRFAPRRCVIAGGTANSLGRLVAAQRFETLPPSLNQMRIPIEELDALRRDLVRASHDERLAMRGMSARRADLLPLGATILVAVANRLGLPAFTLSEWGLREGALLDALGLAQEPGPMGDELRRNAVVQLRRGWGLDPRGAEGVRRVALRLFQATQSLHGLGAEWRELLEHAASLSDLGSAISARGQHKLGAQLVERAGLRGFSPEEGAILACVLRFQKASEPRSRYAPFARLSSAERKATKLLTALLRLAAALEGQPGAVAGVRAEAGPETLRLVLVGTDFAALAAARDQAAARCDLLERALGRSIALEAPRPDVPGL